MRCPECGDECSREDYEHAWCCCACGWSTSQGSPMLAADWERWLEEGAEKTT